MKHTFRTASFCLALTVIIGCAGMGKKMSDEEMIRTTINTLKTALEAKDLDLLMTTFSEDFYHPEVGGKADGRELLQAGIDAGYADDGQVILDDMEITMNADGTATVYPIDLSSVTGSISVELKLQKETDGWLIVEVTPDGM